jgi:replication factor C small subunit
MEIWMEKYRPKEFDDIVGLDSSIPNCIKENSIPHLLFYGSPGTGKTTTALAIIKKLKADSLELNASNERGIDTIRNKVSNFASTMSTNGYIKIIFLDEADALTKDAQDSLRNIMEKYASNCRFVLSCNYENKISEAIKSRCNRFKFQLPKKEDIFNRLKYIVDIEKVNISNELLNLLIDKTYPDIRSAVVKLQSLHTLGREITNLDINKDALIVEEIFKKINEGIKFTEIRQWILDSALEYKTVLIEMYNYILKNKDKFGKLTVPYITRIKDCNRYLNMCISQDIEFEYMLFGIMQDYKKNA